MVIHDPKVFKFKLADLGNFFSAKKGEELPQFCVFDMDVMDMEASFPFHAHKTMQPPLLLCSLPMICQRTLGSIFNFSEGVNEGNKL